jgi:peptidyl-prolyl cis-trans isomerase C
MRTPITLLRLCLLLVGSLALPIATQAQTTVSPNPRLGIAPSAMTPSAMVPGATVPSATVPSATVPSGVGPSGMSPSGVAPSGASPTGAGPSADAAAPLQGPADPIVASVEGHLIYLSDLGEASKTLPENLRGMPFDSLYPVLLDRMVDHQALVMMAERKGLEQKKAVQREIQAATERILEGAYLGEVAAPQVTEQAIQARYNQQFANRSATEEVRARHILVSTEAEARKVLQDLKNGTDFAAIARVLSKDPDASKGGDLGFFRREQVWPSFADVAFSLQPGQVAPNPIKNEFGWHVVKVEERRLVAPPTFAEVHDQLRQQILAAAVQRAIANARSQLAIHRFNLDGSEIDDSLKLTVTGAGATQTR